MEEGFEISREKSENLIRSLPFAEEVEKAIGRSASYVSIDPAFTPNARRVVEMAELTALQEFQMVEPEHLLLGIIEMGSGRALQIVERLGVSILQLREANLAQIQTLPRQTVSQQPRESETQTSLIAAIPPVRTAFKSLHAIALPQETGCWVAQVNASGSVLDGPNFRSIGYGDSDLLAIALSP